MAKRYSFISTKEDIQIYLHFKDLEIAVKPSYNIIPTQLAPVITNERPEQIQFFTWGLIPAGSSDGKNTGKLINARREGISSANSFRMPIRNRRCLVLADSYYCWKQAGLEKTPYRVLNPKKRLIIMAGIWDIWYNEDYAVKSFSIITLPSIGKLKKISERMPLILDEHELQQKWLNTNDLDEIMDIVNTNTTVNYHAYQIPAKINSLHSNSKDLHDEVLNPQPRI